MRLTFPTNSPHKISGGSLGGSYGFSQDGNGDIQPESIMGYFDLDGNSDLQPATAISTTEYFVMDLNGDWTPAV